MEQSRISIIIPVYGVERYIERCVQSIFEQTYSNLEIIIVNDCTLDKSIDLVQSTLQNYPARYKQTIIINQPRNLGLSAARNAGIKAATGDFVYNIDSDDYIEPNTIELLVKKQNESDADIVTGWMCINEDKIVSDYVEPEYENKEMMLMSLLGNMQHHELCGRLIRTSLYKDNKLLALEGLNHGEGFFAIARLTYFARKISLVKKYLYHYVMNDDSYTHSFVDWNKEKSGLDQGQLNQFGVRDFFSDKEPFYYEAILKTCLQQIFYRLIRAIEVNDKEYYRKQYSYIKEYSKEEVANVAGTKIAKLLQLPFSYYLIRYYLSIVTSIK